MPNAECRMPNVNRRARRARSVVVVRTDRTVVIRTQPDEERQEIQRHRQRILHLRDPRRRGGRHRVNREEKPGEPCARNAQAQQHAPDEHRRGGVKQHVHDVVAARMIRPQPPFHPEDAGGEREVVRRLRREPEPPQPVGRLDQLVGIEEAVVVPEEPAVPHHRQVNEERDEHDGRGQEELPRSARPASSVAFGFMGSAQEEDYNGFGTADERR